VIALDVEAGVALTATFVSAVVLTGAVRRFALSHGMLDVPNDRSSHKVPTPRGGGIAIVAAATLGFTILALRQAASLRLFLALMGGGLAVAVVGFLDDKYRLSASIRLVVHVAAASWALAWLGGVPPIRIADHVVSFGWAGHALAVLGFVWIINLFNFMDGIDGIAATEAAFVGSAGALAVSVVGTSTEVSSAALVLAAASLGFLIWNWPPARIFMGDVGSGYLGYVIAVLSLASAQTDQAALLVWLIFGAAFFTDALVTLVRRLVRGDAVYEAHRTHAYQWLSRRWKSHRRVTLAFLAVNVIWLLPLGMYANSHPERVIWIVAIALAPLAALASIAGAGRRETVASDCDTNQASSP
jgi:Fuc2NAc and GlcNAc transferase